MLLVHNKHELMPYDGMHDTSSNEEEIDNIQIYK